MKNVLIFANWKSNKSKNEAKKWLEEVYLQNIPQSLEVVILPSFTLLDYVSAYIKTNGLRIKVGAQDVSPFENGPYTGEVSASQIKELSEFALIGHSERRTNFGESDEMVRNKVEKAASFGLIPVVCASDLSQLDGLQSYKDIVIAYEPLASIGTGNPEDPSSVENITSQIKAKKISRVIYGGSINAENVKTYLSLENIDGVLIGGESLDAQSFINILKNVV